MQISSYASANTNCFIFSVSYVFDDKTPILCALQGSGRFH